jgi:hypothetical protein
MRNGRLQGRPFRFGLASVASSRQLGVVILVELMTIRHAQVIADCWISTARRENIRGWMGPGCTAVEHIASGAPGVWARNSWMGALRPAFAACRAWHVHCIRSLSACADASESVKSR